MCAGPGGIALDANAAMDMTDSSVLYCSAARGGGLSVGRTAETELAIVHITNSVFSYNSASVKGGAIYTGHVITYMGGGVLFNTAPVGAGVYKLLPPRGQFNFVDAVIMDAIEEGDTP